MSGARRPREGSARCTGNARVPAPRDHRVGGGQKWLSSQPEPGCKLRRSALGTGRFGVKARSQRSSSAGGGQSLGGERFGETGASVGVSLVLTNIFPLCGNDLFPPVIDFQAGMAAFKLSAEPKADVL